MKEFNGDFGLSNNPLISSLATNIRRQLKNINNTLMSESPRDSALIDMVANADDHAHRIQRECEVTHEN